MKTIELLDQNRLHDSCREKMKEAVNRLMDNPVTAPETEVRLLEEELAQYMGVKHVICCAGSRDALYAAIACLDLPPGSEIITADFAFVSAAEAIRMAGHLPVLVDIAPLSFTLDIEKVRSAISSRCKAILPLHIYGQCVDMEALLDLAVQHDLYIIEDASQAIGAEYIFSDGSFRKAGAMGNIGITSFFPNRDMGTLGGDGGAIFTDDDALARRIRSICNHGRYGPRYSCVGISSRLDPIQAAILRLKLRHLPGNLMKRLQAAAIYDSLLDRNPYIGTPRRMPYSTHSFHKYTLKVPNGKRNELKDHLRKNGIESRICYSTPIHLEPAYYDCRFSASELAQAQEVCESVLSIPLHPAITIEQQRIIAEAISRFFNPEVKTAAKDTFKITA
jgi:dTDP-4-amino-4,6-dideoxygalactose transaminase